MNISFKNKVVLITGGNSGIGRCISDKFIKLGATVIITTTKRKLISKKKKIFKYLDFNNSNSINNFFLELKKIKKIDILVNNAGINKLYYINNINECFMKKIFNINIQGPILLTREVSKIMIKKNYGKIINISSVFGSISKSGRSLYSSTKFGINGLTKAASLDLAKNNILVNSVSPGVINTKLTNKILGKTGIKKITRDIPLGRIGTVADVANLVCYLSSDYNNYITGQNFIIDGGYTSQ
jgi:NAD(P)-dependent dehydrogenase (short-subunit alcohol dehydrogenase family)